MQTPDERANIDFRFASAEDAAEIVSLVNNAFQVEKGMTGLAFTSRDRVTAEEVEACLHGGRCDRRWLVLETPHPEETMVAAALICAEASPGMGAVEVLAVDPVRQGKGLGSRLLRRAEGVLLSLRCRFVRIRVAQWRGDVLAWTRKRGYKETGGGLWGELDVESAEALTRPTRYLLLTRDLLADEAVAGSFGDGTTGAVIPIAAPVGKLSSTKVAAALDLFSSKPASVQVLGMDVGRGSDDQQKSSASPKDCSEEGDPRLGLFLSSVLRGLRGVEEDELAREDGKTTAQAPAPAALLDVIVDLPSSIGEPHNADLPPRPPMSARGEGLARSQAGYSCTLDPLARDPCGDTGVETQTVGDLNAQRDLENDVAAVDLASTVTSVTVDGENSCRGQGWQGEESIESLLTSLMRALNTERGRADFAKLTAEDAAT
ncbi:unnamed protein product [Ascophyllum nodosum]